MRILGCSNCEQLLYGENVLLRNGDINHTEGKLHSLQRVGQTHTSVPRVLLSFLLFSLRFMLLILICYYIIVVMNIITVIDNIHVFVLFYDIYIYRQWYCHYFLLLIMIVSFIHVLSFGLTMFENIYGPMVIIFSSSSLPFFPVSSELSLFLSFSLSLSLSLLFSHTGSHVL